MISKEVLHVTNEITKFGANHVTVPIFASIVYFTIKDMQMYCLDMEFFNDEFIKTLENSMYKELDRLINPS